MRVYRITLERFGTPAAAFSGVGVAKAAGRWNWQADDIRGVYCADSLALSCLETLVHIRARPRMFPASVYYTAEIPDTLIKRPALSVLPAGWDADVPQGGSRDYGTAFLRSRSAVGIALPTTVQSVGFNVLINTRHPSFTLKWVAGPFPYKYDKRLA